MIDKKLFKKSFSLPFDRSGFIKKGQTWDFFGKDVIVVVNLQKCDWGEYYFINVGFYLKAFGEVDFPLDNQCHLGYRAENFFPEKRGLILVGCSLEKGTPEILADLVEFLDDQFIPFLKECTEVSKLQELMAKGILNRGLVLREARRYLSGSESVT